jgi:hypothetical protein
MVNKIVQDSLNHLVEDLRATHGDNLAVVVLYGSAATGESNELRADYNLLIALHRITPEDLRQAQAPMREWQRLGHQLPVYFTVEELADAADVFPIEFHQMSKARRVLFGSDPFEAFQLSTANLRHQTEYELRSKLIQLRQLYIPASVNADRLAALMSDSLSSFAALFRAVLLLNNQEPPVAKPDCVRATVRLLKLESGPFEKIFQLRAGGGAGTESSNLTDHEANDLFAAYLAQIERVIESVDQLEGKS